IPKGTTVIGNVWSVSRDPAVFDPQRWIWEDGSLREDLRSYPFGFGHRICPIQHIATASVMLNTAIIQWVFTVCKDPKYTHN
ncbi:hypothetical protein C0991_010538, partial [Blastosporella zonata]